MLFNSVEFVVFLAVVVALYAIVPQTIRWIILLISSYYFYMSWKIEYGLLILASTAINYVAAIVMTRVEQERTRFVICSAAVILTLGILFTFKYIGFAIDSINGVTESLLNARWIDPIQLVLPVGISFFTFQTLSYTIDVYRRTFTAVTHFGKFALYIVFFPQLVAGPIERPQNLMSQILSPPTPTPALFASGLQLILWGAIKKIVVADHLALYVNEVYNNPGANQGIAVILATLFFAIQIYCDFSGYTDIAIGSARLLGFRLMQNFDRPYLATSIQDFWRRWHISLSTWFRDYVYIPLGGNRGTVAIKNRNLLLTFVISGLWHGAAWTFVVWGAIHGVFIVLEQLLNRTGIRFQGIAGWAYTFTVVNLAWVFFRCNQIQDIPTIFTSAMNLSASALFVPSISKIDNLLCPLLAIGLLTAERLSTTSCFRVPFQNSLAFRYALYVTGILLVTTLGVFGRPNEFIYFQF